MAEALAALGLAANIINFVDFGIRLFSSSRELYQSAEGALKENIELAESASNIRLVVQRITNSIIGIDEPALREVAGTCLELADELLEILNGLKVENQKHRKAETLRKSLKGIRSRHKVKDLYDRLCKVREQICFHLSCLLTNRQAVLLPAIHDSLDANKALATETRDKLDVIISDIQQIIGKKPWRQGDDDALSNVSTHLTGLIEQARTTRKVHKFLKSLYFEQIKVRQFGVKAAHNNTFDWIFQLDGSLNFAQWLLSSDDIFWIGGKAGSGKSTLMKFLCGHPRLRVLLQEWAERQNILIASHFFWGAGTSMQKSQEGLLQTLLFEILCHSPELIPNICPNSWNADGPLDSFHKLQPWSLSELSEAFNHLASIEYLPVRICLFIDGLDEYDGEHSDIIHIVKILGKSPHIKLCVSSRSWPVFEDAFGGSHWKLYLQDLTLNDIKLYIKDNLEEDPHFRRLELRDSVGSENLVKEIVSKAQGVFLWVYLVVRSLLRGLTNRDDMLDLQRRLGELPGDLETYFKHMFDTIEFTYQEQTARIFRIMVNASATLPLIGFYFVDQEKQDANYALRREMPLLMLADIESIMDTKKRQLNARCKDLVEVTTDPHDDPVFKYKAGFLHRTVVDFLRTKDMESLISTRSGPDFNPNLSLCKSYLAQVKLLPALCKSHHSILRNLVLGTLYYARELEILDNRVEAEILDELDKTVLATNGRWDMISPRSEREKSHPVPPFYFKNFLEVSVRCGFHHYIDLAVKDSRTSLRELATREDGSHEPPLLSQALQRGISIRKEYGFESYWTSVIDISMLRLLLNLGASPAQIFSSRRVQLEHYFPQSRGKKERPKLIQQTTWTNFLEHHAAEISSAATEWDHTLHDLCDKPLRTHDIPLSNAFEACEMMVPHFRPHDQQIFLASKEMLRRCFTENEALRLEKLLKHESDQKSWTWWKLWR
ncbi:hypothetical protein V8E51_018134 [Hyaloscypha variabilis]